MRHCNFARFLGALLLCAAVPAAMAQGNSALHRKVRDYHPRLTGLSQAQIDEQTAAGTTIPLWTSSVSTGGTKYTYQMVGKNPKVAQSVQTSTIPTPVIPVIFKFYSNSTGTGTPFAVFNPTVGGGCSPSGSALNLTLASPIFMNHGYTVGGTSIGTTQYVDFFQRANWYKFTKPGSTNPSYHVLLSSASKAAITIKVVNAVNGVDVQSAPCGKLGFIEINQWDNLVRSSLIPGLASSGVGPTTFPIFLFYNVVMYDTTLGNCCILGYHNAFSNGGVLQTYAIADYDSSQAFSGFSDITGLSHEVGEWMDDPKGTNPTPAWGNIGQVTGCQGNLEVGDPLSGTTHAVKMANGFTYHPQEMAFFSWFYHQNPSLGVNGWYSNFGKFRTFAAACP